MTFLPIVERELRVRARRRSTYRFRMLSACAAAVLVASLLVFGDTRSLSGQYGSMVFLILAWVSFGFCLMEGARTTADCLSSEKREGTLGLLFLTDLQPYDVVLGKLMATSLSSVYGLLSILPPLGIPILLGGVTGDEFWRLILVLLNTLFLSLTAGLAVSAVCRDERTAWSWTMGLMLVLALGPSMLLLHPKWAANGLAALGLLTGFVGVFDASYSAAPFQFWRSVAWAHGLGWGALLAATFLLPRCWQDRGERVMAHAKDARGVDRQLELDARQRRRRSMILAGNPVAWLVLRGQGRRTMLWTIVILVGVGAAAAWILGSGSMVMGLGLLPVFLLAHLGLACWVASEACHLLSARRDSGELELILCTPLTPAKLVRGHLEGLRRSFGQPFAVLMTFEVVLTCAQLSRLAASGTSEVKCLFLGVLIVMTLAGSWLDLVAVAHYGLWQGLAQPKPAAALNKTLLHVLILPLIPVLFTGGLLLPVVGLVKNLILINHAQEKLRRFLRPMLTQRFTWGRDSEELDSPARRPARPSLPSVWPR